MRLFSNSRHRHWIAGLLAAVVISGCGLLPETKDETAKWDAERFYKEAKTATIEGNYTRAIKLFEQLEAKYPYGKYAQAALLEVAYANYKSQEPAAAVSAADRFIKLYPNHPNVDYAYYLKGLSNFIEDLGFLSFLSDQDMSERDPKATQDSFETFKQLVTKFPTSRYAADATQRLRYLGNALASHEVHVARHYYKRGAYVAAAARAQHSLLSYPQNPANEEALVLMIKSYEALGMAQLRDDAKRILDKTFPNSRYLAFDYRERPWWKFW